jgi:hypothetical protein
VAHRLHDGAVEVAQQRQNLVYADVDAEDVSGRGVELVAAGRAADGAVGAGLQHDRPAVGDQSLRDDVDRGAGQAGALRQLGDGRGRLVAQGAHDAQGVEFAQARQIRSGGGQVCHGSPFDKCAVTHGRYAMTFTKYMGDGQSTRRKAGPVPVGESTRRPVPRTPQEIGYAWSAGEITAVKSVRRPSMAYS